MTFPDHGIRTSNVHERGLFADVIVSGFAVGARGTKRGFFFQADMHPKLNAISLLFSGVQRVVVPPI